MGVFEIFSKRVKRAAGQFPDVYQYETMPHAFKVQILHMIAGAFDNVYGAQGYYEQIVRVLTREYGRFSLTNDKSIQHRTDYYRLDLSGFLLDEKSIELNMDVVETCLLFIDGPFRRSTFESNDIARDIIEEFNVRAKEHGLGYEYVEGRIIRIDSEIIHQGAVLPVLAVFRRGNYNSARDEFLSAHEHYRNKRYQQALVDCLKAFESTMKIICDRRGWSYNDKKGASELVRACIDNGLIPDFWLNHFSGLRSTLESAIPTPRNRIGGHGAGSMPVQDPPEELVSYVLHMTAATILFLSEADAKLR